VDAVRGALNEAQTNNVAGFPALKSVTIKLQTVASRSVGGQVQFLVFSLGTRYTADAASTVELEMVPPKTSDRESLVGGAALKDALAQAINLAKVEVLKVQGNAAARDEEHLIDEFAVDAGTGGATVTSYRWGSRGPAGFPARKSRPSAQSPPPAGRLLKNGCGRRVWPLQTVMREAYLNGNLFAISESEQRPATAAVARRGAVCSVGAPSMRRRPRRASLHPAPRRCNAASPFSAAR
jgi:hypothetical protein